MALLEILFIYDIFFIMKIGIFTQELLTTNIKNRFNTCTPMKDFYSEDRTKYDQT